MTAPLPSEPPPPSTPQTARDEAASPETPELSTLLDKMMPHSHRPHIEGCGCSCCAARSALLALYDRQREEIERLKAEQTPRPLQTSVQWEPPYPAHETAIVSTRYPYHTAHKPTTLCAIEAPHLIEDCGEFER